MTVEHKAGDMTVETIETWGSPHVSVVTEQRCECGKSMYAYDTVKRDDFSERPAHVAGVLDAAAAEVGRMVERHQAAALAVLEGAGREG
ncbi:hypothetical protein SEA_GOIB_74 [Gordonia phage Goib]|nr:hypothetical protein SEA_GOIB_74 [Gordonia phage Goib]